ncbi:MAG: class II fumarate hydratase [Chloroflexota bacterium]|nr:class II fumarate hydratase [Chloroflexota bacterium]
MTTGPGPTTDAATRTERDSMGEMDVPADALYGASTQRAVLNFPISGQRFPRPFIRALALIKQVAAETNAELGLLDPELAAAIAAAAAEVADGGHDEQFPIDVYQTGSGTSTNTNMNEVIANLATRSLAAMIGDSTRVHPNDHVNRCQSSNDVIPTALQLSAAMEIEERLLPALEMLRVALDAKADEFWPIVKTGRTHLQDATPIRLGQEFRGYAGQLEESIRRARAAQAELLSVPLGGTAVGTGINAHPQFAAGACRRLSVLTGLDVRETTNHFHAQATLDAAIAAHGALRTIALSLWKIASDIRLMGMGPRAGLAEIALPETQPGSSIMPGKVNPVIVESLTMVVARVLGNDTTVAFGQTGSFLELNVMLPVTSAALLESIALLAAGARNVADRAVTGLTATDRGPALVEQGLMLATALAPEIGYDAAAALAKEAFKTGRTIRELATERGIASQRLDELLDPASMTEPGLGGGPAGG